ncbi:MAG: serine/threonine-protein phosphatase [Actinobacteria bacterium]|nr:serine/threonine-protein phosphatase [Actinomycetota bacterium]
MEYFATTDIGNYREQNEDFFYAEDSLFVVADGMGGHKAGEVASRMAVESFVNHFKSHISTLSTIEPKNGTKKTKKIVEFESEQDRKESETRDKSRFTNEDKVQDNTSERIKILLSTSIEIANKKVFNLSISNYEFAGMGTTFTGAYIDSYKAYCIHVGDSRLYLKRGESISLLTEDHTVVGKLYRNGKITYEEMSVHPYRNILTNVLGVDMELSYDSFFFDLKPNDILLLCTDGLNSMLDDQTILRTIEKYENVESIGKNLINLAKKRGGFDNITVVVVRLA